MGRSRARSVSAPQRCGTPARRRPLRALPSLPPVAFRLRSPPSMWFGPSRPRRRRGPRSMHPRGRHFPRRRRARRLRQSPICLAAWHRCRAPPPPRLLERHPARLRHRDRTNRSSLARRWASLDCLLLRSNWRCQLRRPRRCPILERPATDSACLCGRASAALHSCAREAWEGSFRCDRASGPLDLDWDRAACFRCRPILQRRPGWRCPPLELRRSR